MPRKEVGSITSIRALQLFVMSSLLIVILFGPLSMADYLPAKGDNKIAFCSNRDGNWEIYVMNADGSDPIRLTSHPAAGVDPSWSPDGSRIAFWSYRDGNYEIYIMDANGSNQTRLTYNSLQDTYPDWSPDGKKIAFHSYRDGNWEIYVMNADGSNQTRLTNNPGNDWEPSWSPDGSKIAFHSNGDIYVMDTDGSNQTRLTHTSADEQDPAWSPDGTRIAFESNRDGNYEIYIMDADGSNQTRLTYNPDFDTTPTWSPDGTKLAFVRGACVLSYATEECSGESEIYIVDAKGCNELAITHNLFDDDFPNWLVIPVLNKLPQADFTFMPTDPTVLDEVMFNDHSSDLDGEVTSWQWAFGDGTVSTERDPVHQYKQEGTFTVTLTVTDNEDLTNQATQTITIEHIDLIQADFTFELVDAATNKFRFDASSSMDTTGTIIRYEWDWASDGTYDTAVEVAEMKHRFPGDGPYQVTLTIVDNQGNRASCTKEVTS